MTVTILVTPQGTTLTLPNGNTFICIDHHHKFFQLWLSTTNAQIPQTADIYWGMVVNPSTAPLILVFSEWHSLIALLVVYEAPPDLPQVTLCYDTSDDYTYQTMFKNELAGKQCTVISPGIVIGPQGVAAPITLTPEQLSYYRMSDTAAPHLSLAPSPGHQAKELGPMVKVD